MKDTSGNAVPAGADRRVPSRASSPARHRRPPDAYSHNPDADDAHADAHSVEPPTVTSIQFVPGDDDRLVIRFSKDVSASFSLDDVIVSRTKAGFQTPHAQDVHEADVRQGDERGRHHLPPAHASATAGRQLEVDDQGRRHRRCAGNKLDGNGDGSPGDDAEFKFKKAVLVLASR